MYSTRKEFKAGYISNKRSVWSFRCVTAVWLVCWTLPWRRITSGAKWPASWTSWLTWAWLDSEWMPASTCGPVTCLLSTVVCTTSTPSGSLVAPGPSSSRRCFFFKDTNSNQVSKLTTHCVLLNKSCSKHWGNTCTLCYSLWYIFSPRRDWSMFLICSQSPKFPKPLKCNLKPHSH